jgi:hypothetical protein
MISHEYKCIFIHIPATAGTSIEEWIVGRDWWEVSPPTKHLFASQARREYSEYWDEYFKFSIVRDPVKRMRSCLRFPELSFLQMDEAGNLHLDEYLRVYSRNGTILEYDWRFHERDEVELPHHVTHSLYGNILDEKLDYIGRFEDLEGVVQTLRERTGIERTFASHLQASPKKLAAAEISERTRRDIERLFWRDYTRFGFQASSGFDATSIEEEIQNAGPTEAEARDNALDILKLQNKISELRLTRKAFHSLVDELNEKNKVISILQETVTNLIVDRDAYKSALEETKSVNALLVKTIEDLIVDRDAYKAVVDQS